MSSAITTCNPPTAIAWSCVARDGIILAEAGRDDGKGNVIQMAKKISTMKPTCGWELTPRGIKKTPYRGIKFHLHDAVLANNSHAKDKIIIWTFCCVYDPKRISVDYVKAFLTKTVYVTEPLREMPWWREGTILSAQPSFASTLEQQMEGAEGAAKSSMMRQQVDETRLIIASNIEQILDRGARIEDLEKEAEEMSRMSRVFKKKAKQLKRFKMWQNAKHGVMVGTAVTGAVGVCMIPPLIALL